MSRSLCVIWSVQSLQLGVTLAQCQHLWAAPVAVKGRLNWSDMSCENDVPTSVLAICSASDWCLSRVMWTYPPSPTTVILLLLISQTHQERRGPFYPWPARQSCSYCCVVRSKSSGWLTLKYGHFRPGEIYNSSKYIPTQTQSQYCLPLHLIQISSFKTTRHHDYSHRTLSNIQSGLWPQSFLRSSQWSHQRQSKKF